MSQVFTAWATWEKLTFILACAIVVVILAGAAKLGYAHWKLRKYTAVAEKEKQDQKLRRQMSQRQRPPASEDGDVPFGIRAIESGIEVDGVWISRNNTPEPTSRASSMSFSWDRVPQKGSDIERPEPAQDKSGSSSTVSTPRPLGSAFDRTVSAKRVPSGTASRDSSPVDLVPKPPKSRHPPSSMARFSTTPYLVRQDSATLALQGLEAVFHAAGPMRDGPGHSNGEESFSSSESSNRSSYDIAEVDSIAASAPRLLNQQARRQQQKQSSTDFHLMHSHRLSQAAETGQLTPRARKPGNSGEWASVTPGTTSSGYGDPFHQSRILPTDTPNPFHNLPMTAKIDALPPAVRRSSLPDVTPFAKFCQTAPPCPRSDARRPVSADGGQPLPSSTASQVAYELTAPDAGRTTSIPPLSTTHQQAAEPQPTRSSFERCTSAVVRGHGTGFEILRPGTLNPLVPVPMDEGSEKRSGPPISLYNNSSRARSSSADSRRKLQKKRRPSNDSETSTETCTGNRASVI